MEITIKQEQERMRPLLLKGTKCACCQQHVQMYERPITSAMAIGLIKLYNAPADSKTDGGYIHIENYFKELKDLPSSVRGDIPKLRFWGLIQPWGGNTEEGDGNPNSGLYRITELGKRFVELKDKVHPVVRLYNNKFYGYKEGVDHISISKALGKKFNYRELMGLPPLTAEYTEILKRELHD